MFFLLLLLPILIHPTGTLDELKWAIKAAGKTNVVIAGGTKRSEDELAQEIEEAIQAGCSGVAIGRNVWQSKDPIATAEKIRGAIWK